MVDTKASLQHEFRSGLECSFSPNKFVKLKLFSLCGLSWLEDLITLVL